MNVPRFRTIIFACGVLVALIPWTIPARLSAQNAAVGFHVQSYHMSDANDVALEKISLMAVPWSFGWTPGRSVDVSIEGGWARASASAANGETADIEGLSDTQARLALAWRRLDVNLHAALPTGRSTLSVEEATVIGLTTSELLPIGVTPQWGSGFGLGAELATGFRWGPTRVTVGGGYSTSGEFEPLEGMGAAYAPGDETRARAAIDTQLGAATFVSLLVGFQSFGVDEVDAVPVVSPGDRLETRLSLALPIGARESIMLFGGISHRADGEVGTDRLGRPNPIEVLLPGATVPLSQSLIATGAELLVTRGRLTMLPTAELRILRSAQGVGQGWLSSIGARGEYLASGERFGRRLILEPGIAFRFGKVLPGGPGESYMIGWQMELIGRWQVGR